MKLAVLQARSSSVRMPGKVLAPLLGEPMIVRQVERVRQSKHVDELVVVTSVDETDDRLVAVLESRDIRVRRGPLDDVLARFLQVIEEFAPRTVVRLTGDNPLVDPVIIDEMVLAHDEAQADCTSNSVERTFPYGLDVECVRADAFRRLGGLPLSTSEREHVTLGLYNRRDSFAVHQVTQSPDRSDLRWTVDYPEDFAVVEQIYEELYEPGQVFGQREILHLIERRPELRRTRADVST